MHSVVFTLVSAEHSLLYFALEIMFIHGLKSEDFMWELLGNYYIFYRNERGLIFSHRKVVIFFDWQLLSLNVSLLMGRQT